MIHKEVFYGVFVGEVLITHKICREPKINLFPAIFNNYEEAVDYARGVGVVKQIHIKVNKKILYKGDKYD